MRTAPYVSGHDAQPRPWADAACGGLLIPLDCYGLNSRRPRRHHQTAGTDGCQESIGSVQAVVIDLATGEHRGAADPRREGTVIRVKP